MESRFLLLLLVQVSSSSASRVAAATGSWRDDNGQPPVIEPDIERREIDTAKIDTEDFEVGLFAGQLSVEDFGVNTVAGSGSRITSPKGSSRRSPRASRHPAHELRAS